MDTSASQCRFRSSSTEQEGPCPCPDRGISVSVSGPPRALLPIELRRTSLLNPVHEVAHSTDLVPRSAFSRVRPLAPLMSSSANVLSVNLSQNSHYFARDAFGSTCLFNSGTIVPEGPYPCPDCGKSFTAMWCLEFHICEVRREKARLAGPSSASPPASLSEWWECSASDGERRSPMDQGENALSNGGYNSSSNPCEASTAPPNGIQPRCPHGNEDDCLWCPSGSQKLAGGSSNERSSPNEWRKNSLNNGGYNSLGEPCKITPTPESYAARPPCPHGRHHCCWCPPVSNGNISTAAEPAHLVMDGNANQPQPPVAEFDSGLIDSATGGGKSKIRSKRRKHMEVTRFQCLICHGYYSTIGNLRRHERLIHGLAVKADVASQIQNPSGRSTYPGES